MNLRYSLVLLLGSAFLANGMTMVEKPELNSDEYAEIPPLPDRINGREEKKEIGGADQDHNFEGHASDSASDVSGQSHSQGFPMDNEEDMLPTAETETPNYRRKRSWPPRGFNRNPYVNRNPFFSFRSGDMHAFLQPNVPRDIQDMHIQYIQALSHAAKEKQRISKAKQDFQKKQGPFEGLPGNDHGLGIADRLKGPRIMNQTCCRLTITKLQKLEGNHSLESMEGILGMSWTEICNSKHLTKSVMADDLLGQCILKAEEPTSQTDNRDAEAETKEKRPTTQKP